MKARYVGAPAAPSLSEAQALLRCTPHTELAARLAAVVAEGPVRGESIVDIG